MFAERHVVEWVDCPCDDDPDTPLLDCEVPRRQCPIYNPFIWQTAFVLQGEPMSLFFPGCAETTHSICYYKHPTAVDFAGNISTQPMLLWPPPIRGGCPPI